LGHRIRDCCVLNVYDKDYLRSEKVKKIFRYILEVIENQTVDIPSPAIILSVVDQGVHIVVYAIADDGEDIPIESIDILTKETGHTIQDDIDLYTFIGTVKLYNINPALHVFYRRRVVVKDTL
jgi:hypothetical protein